ncbi:MAG: riboflavin biosynthesis protein RibF [Lachnospiraceae bacterium]|nr:riboflavin biosynthesis protein RibF [Lachnospiraceae bacterium]
MLVVSYQDVRPEAMTELIDSFDGGMAVTLGKMDGLHRGHMELVREIVDHAKKYNENHRSRRGSVVVSFGKQVYRVVTNQNTPVLSTLKEQELILKSEGVLPDLLVEYPFTPELRDMEADCFLETVLRDTFGCRFVSIGDDFCFGHMRRGNAAYMKRYGDDHGFETSVHAKLTEEGRVISSTAVAEEVTKGHMQKATAMLGRPYSVYGEVVHGNHYGTGMGFPTANQVPAPEKLLPPNGVYLSRTYVVSEGKWYESISNIGTRPTVTQDTVRTCETHIYSFHEDIYGKEILVELLSFMRPERAFCTITDLTEQVMADMEMGRALHRNR